MLFYCGRTGKTATRASRAFLIMYLLTALYLVAEDPAPFEGRSKIETEHFVIIFEPKNSEPATYLASIAEEAYTQISSTYSSFPDTVYCVIDSRSDLYVSSYSPLPAHITVSIHGPTWPMFGPRSNDWLKIILLHELTHNVQLTYESGLFYYLSKIFGQGLNAVPASFLPTWAVEGPAVLYETFFTSGGRGDSEHFEMLSSAMADGFFSYTKAGSTTVFEPSSRPYVAGYLMSEHINRVYGTDALKNIHAEFLKFPFFGPGAAIRKVTGQSAKEIFGDVVEEVRRRAAAYQSVTEIDPVTPDGYGNYFLPRITQKGWIVYRYTHDLPAALVLFDPESGAEEVVKVTGLTDPSSFAADRTGKTVVYSSRTTSLTPAGRAVYSDLFFIDTDSGRTERITENARLWHPAINPKTDEIVAVAGLGPESCLVKVDPETGSHRVLFRQTGATVYNPVFSEDGKNLFFSMNTDGTQDIWALPYPNAESARRVTGPDSAAEFFPRVTENTLVYSSDRDGSLAIYAQPAFGGNRVKITGDRVGAYAGMINKEKVVYATYTRFGYALKRIPLPVLPPTMENGGPMTAAAGGGVPPSQSVVKAAQPAVSPYYDLPKLLFWLPLPVSYDPFSGALVDTGAGVFFTAGSILGANSLTGIFTYNWDELQPALDFETRVGIGKTLLAYRGYYGYNQTEDGAFRQNFSSRLSGSYPIISEYRFPKEEYLSAGAALQYDTATAYSDTFGFLTAPEDAVTASLLQTSARIGYANAVSGARKDFFSPFRFSTWGELGVSIPIDSPADSAPWIGSGAGIQLKSPIRHQVIGFGVDGIFTPEIAGATPHPFPRSGLSPAFSPSNLSLLAAVDYRFHIALLDLPLPYGYSLNHLAGGIYVETTASVDKTGFAIGRFLFPGFEIIVNFGTVSHFPVGIGVGFRVDPHSISEFTLLSDTRIYLTGGSGGFLPFLDLAGSGSYPMGR